MTASHPLPPVNTPPDAPSRPKVRLPAPWLRHMPPAFKRFGSRLYWLAYDLRDFLAEMTGWLPSHNLRMLIYRFILKMQVGKKSSIHLRCRMYRPSMIRIANNSVINRQVLLDGRMRLTIGANVSISEGVAIFTLEHDPQSPTFANRGGPVQIADYVFIGARAIILPGIHLHEGAVVAAGAVVTRDVPAYTIVAGVPAREIGRRRQDLRYTLDYRKFLG